MRLSWHLAALSLQRLVRLAVDADNAAPKTLQQDIIRLKVGAVMHGHTHCPTRGHIQ